MSPNLPPRHRRIGGMIVWDCLCSSWVIRETPAFWLLTGWCGVMPRVWTCNPLGCRVNTMLSVDGHDRHSNHLSSRSRKWELEGSCYPAPSFLPVLHRAKLKPCVLSPCGPSTCSLTGWRVGKCCGRLNNMWSQETFSPSLLPLLFESLLCITPLGSLGKVVSDSFLCLVSKDTALPLSPFLRAFIQGKTHDGCDWGSTVVCPKGQRSFPDTQAATG